jgi:predicted NBD/HSP70 family sugar kinase
LRVGIGVAIDGGIYAGNKNAAGEFIGFSWDPDIVGDLKHIPMRVEWGDADKRFFSEFIIELFSSFVSVVAVLNPEMVFAYGDLARYSTEVQQIVQRCVPQFNAIMERTSCVFSFADSSIFSVATGAALMYFLHLFSTTGYSFGRIDSVADWDAVFALSSQSKTAVQCV